jgi:hypothetical protein
VKGLGGFHLACDARSVVAVRKLRARKHRPAKPLAVMFPTLADVERAAFVSPRERESLTSVRAPIVLLRRRADADVEGPLCTEIAPGLDQIGAFLSRSRPTTRMRDGGSPESPIATSITIARSTCASTIRSCASIASASAFCGERAGTSPKRSISTSTRRRFLRSAAISRTRCA